MRIRHINKCTFKAIYKRYYFFLFTHKKKFTCNIHYSNIGIIHAIYQMQNFDKDFKFYIKLIWREWPTTISIFTCSLHFTCFILSFSITLLLHSIFWSIWVSCALVSLVLQLSRSIIYFLSKKKEDLLYTQL